MCNTMTNKSEDFYVISDNGTTVTALAKYDLLVGNTVVFNDDFSDMTSSPISTSEEGYGLQNSIAGYMEFDSEGNPLNHTIKGGMIFANTDESKKNGSDYYGYWSDTSGILLSKYGTSYPAYVFDSNSNLYEPLENYKNYLINTLGKSSITTNLMTYGDLIGLGCKMDGSSGNCSNAPIWVHSTNYWSGTADSSSYVYFVTSYDGSGPVNGFGTVEFNYSLFLGLRPVITIKKSDL